MKILAMLALVSLVSCNSGGGSGGSSESNPQNNDNTTPYQSKLKIKTDGQGNQDITSMKMIVYKIFAGSNEDCSNLSVVKEFDSPIEVELVGGHSYGDINIPDGTYNCIAIEMDRNLKFTPDSLPTRTTATSVTGTGCVIGENESKLVDTSVIQGSYVKGEGLLDPAPVFENYTTGYYDDSVTTYPKIYGRDLAYHADGQGHGLDERIIQGLTPDYNPTASEAPLARITLYMSTKIGARNTDYKFVPPYAAEWSEDGEDYDGSHDRLFDHGGNEVSSYIVQPIDIDGNNNLEFIVAFGASTDVVDNNDPIQCRLKNISFDLQQVD